VSAGFCRPAAQGVATSNCDRQNVATGASRRHLQVMRCQSPNSNLITLAVLTALSACGTGGSGVPSTPVALPAAVVVSGDAAAAARALGRGVNLGNILEAPIEGLWGLRLNDSLFDAARASGAVSIRLPVRWSSHAGATRPYTVDPVFFGRVDYAVDAALSRGMRIVINMHHYRQLDGDALDPQETAVESSVLDADCCALSRSARVGRV
jgi:endoglucanase